jgi:DNA-binding PadR family transcriptional regulator
MKMTDYAILGFLARGPKSGYDIKRLMAVSTSHFYEASYGSIYPSLERMARSGLVEAGRPEGSSRLRRSYSITEEGMKAFLGWLAGPLDIAKGPAQLLLRIFFMGSLESAEAGRVLERFAKSAADRRSWLETATEGLPEEPDFFQAATARFGLGYYAFLETWLEGLRGEIPAKAAKKRAETKGGRR